MDVDLDFPDRARALQLFKHITAVRASDNGFVPHNTGVYFQNIPHNPITRAANIDYQAADDRGYFKIDFLNVGVYRGVRDEIHLVELMTTEPDWQLLQNPEFVSKLFQIGNYAALLQRTQPDSIEKLAAVIAMIRPAKKHLIGKSWPEIFAEVWTKSDDATAGYAYKKSHSISYAVAIVVQMNLLSTVSES
jgi:DNA polymerase III alpha subunit